MRIRWTCLILLSAALLMVNAPAAVAQGVGTSCDISGTWYGGSGGSLGYIFTITPVGAGRYTAVAQLVASAVPSTSTGYYSWGNWTGEINKTGERTYHLYAIQHLILTPETAAAFGANADLPEVDFVQGKIQFTDCNTFTNTIDVFGAYFNFTPAKTPFVDPPDVDVLAFIGVTTITETYHRVLSPKQ